MDRPLESDGSGRCGGDGSFPWMGSRPAVPWPGLQGRCVCPAGRPLGVEPGISLLKRWHVNVGNVRHRPLFWGQLHGLVMVSGRGGGPVVVGAGESPAHGEGVQRKDRAGDTRGDTGECW